MKSFVSIVGGSGFLGSKLSAAFKDKTIEHEIFDISFDINSPNYINVEEMGSLNKLKNSSAIVNLAAVHRDDVKPISRYDDVNVGGARNICDAARKFNINKIIFTSSVAVYGFVTKPTGEDGDINYFNDYGRTKYEAELIYKKWQQEDPHKRSLIIIRPTVIFGEGNKGNFYNLLNQIKSRKFAMIGSGSNIKSMAYVDNVAHFICHTLNFDEGIHLSNYVDEPDLDMNALVMIIRNALFHKNNIGIKIPAFFGLFCGYIADLASFLLGKSLPISSIRVKKFISSTHFTSNSRATGFSPPVSLENGIKKTIKSEFLDQRLDSTIP